jgi:peptidoglycan/xylan/chitin deacetylase (PgdA/CDA1 family)
MCEARPAAAFLRPLFALLLSLWLGVGAGHAEPVALTFDDAPALTLAASAAYTATTTRRLVRGLSRNGLPAMAFVIGDRLSRQPRRRDAILRSWLAQGYPLGNHTWSHPSLNQLSPDAYIGEIARDDALLRRLEAPRHERPHWFRHPYLETGATTGAEQDVERWLGQHGYRVAPVTLENADDVFALPYDQAVLMGEAVRVEAIRRAYLAYTERALRWYRTAALQLFGRPPALIFLLHVSRLNADTLDDLAALLRREGLEPVPLEDAMADPVYRRPVGPDANGDDWLERWAAAMHRPLPWASYPEPPPDMVAASNALEGTEWPRIAAAPTPSRSRPR